MSNPWLVVTGGYNELDSTICNKLGIRVEQNFGTRVSLTRQLSRTSDLLPSLLSIIGNYVELATLVFPHIVATQPDFCPQPVRHHANFIYCLIRITISYVPLLS
ncbi:hypothetical protein ABZP36_022029 [Zizania latifolia]